MEVGDQPRGSWDGEGPGGAGGGERPEDRKQGCNRGGAGVVYSGPAQPLVSTPLPSPLY